MNEITSNSKIKSFILGGILLLITPALSAQAIVLENRPMLQTDFLLEGFDTNNRKIFYNSQKSRNFRAQNAFYLSESWENQVSIRLNSGEVIAYDQCNFNLGKNEFEIKDKEGIPKRLPNDREVTQVIFNGQSFNRFSDERRFYELMREGQNFTLYRLSNIRIKKAFIDAKTMEKVGKDKVSLHHTYFLLRVSDGRLFRASKNNILEMLPDKRSQLKKYMEDNDMSLKDEKDVLKVSQILENLYLKV
ncbi:MAG: hypothetical protein AAF554_08995 [Bacteroidota bacterium]